MSTACSQPHSTSWTLRTLDSPSLPVSMLVTEGTLSFPTLTLELPVYAANVF